MARSARLALLCALVVLGAARPAFASLIDDDLLAVSDLAARRRDLEARVLRARLVALGLTRGEADRRVVALSDQELHQVVADGAALLRVPVLEGTR